MNVDTIIPDRLYRVDTGFIAHRFCGVFILRQGRHAALVESGSTLSVPPTLSTLDTLGIAREDVRALYVTHAHLDHMGGTGLIMQSLPGCTVVCHKATAPHVIDPLAKLCPAAVGVYGQEQFDKDYPGVQRTPEERVYVAEDQEEYVPRDEAGEPLLDLALSCLETFGHSYHHMMFYHAPLKALFTGDGFGFSFSALNRCPLLCTSPSQLDTRAWRGTCDIIESLARTKGVDILLSTHFETVFGCDMQKRLESVRLQLDLYDEIMRTCSTREEVERAYREAIEKSCRAFGVPPAVKVQQMYDLVIGDVNVDGLWYRIKRARAKAGK